METTAQCRATGPCPFRHLTVEQQILAIHLTGRYIGTVDQDGVRIIMCAVGSQVVKIHSRPNEDHWLPYLLVYQPDSQDA